MIKKLHPSPSLFSSLSDLLNSSHPLYKLADKIDWAKFDTAFEPLYSQNNGRPGKPIRLMCGLLILKHLGNLSDEFIVEQWSENAYYQYLFGMQEFTPCAPCASSEYLCFEAHLSRPVFPQSSQELQEGTEIRQEIAGHSGEISSRTEA